MTIEVRIKHMQPGYHKGVEVLHHAPDTTQLGTPALIQPGEDRTFYVYAGCNLLVREPGAEQILPDTFDFGEALRLLKAGRKVARKGWNGKGMWLACVPSSLAEAVTFQYAALKPRPWIGMKTADECFVPWLASQTDMLAEDWTLAE